MSENINKAKAIINQHILMAMGAGAIPIPVADIAAVTSVQLDMFGKLCDLYLVDYSEYLGENIVKAVAGNTLARIGASAIKLLPGFGGLLGGASMSIMSGASTYALGKVFLNHLESGEESLFDFDVEEAKEIFKEELEKGKRYASELKKKVKGKEDTEAPRPKPDGAKPVQTDPESDIFEKLKKLGELRDAGILTQEEFDEKKKALLALI